MLTPNVTEITRAGRGWQHSLGGRARVPTGSVLRPAAVRPVRRLA